MNKKTATRKALLLIKKYKLNNLDDIEIENIKLQNEDLKLYKEIRKTLNRD